MRIFEQLRASGEKGVVHAGAVPAAAPSSGHSRRPYASSTSPRPSLRCCRRLFRAAWVRGRGKPSGAWADHPWLPAASGRGQLCTRRKGVGPVSSLAKVQKKLLFDTLIPLLDAYGENLCWILVSKEDTRHKPNEWLLWDRQTPMISMYHKAVLMSTCAMNLDSFILSLVGARPLHARKLGAREAEWRTPTPCTSAEAAHARERSHTGWKVRGGQLDIASPLKLKLHRHDDARPSALTSLHRMS